MILYWPRSRSRASCARQTMALRSNHFVSVDKIYKTFVCLHEYHQSAPLHRKFCFCYLHNKVLWDSKNKVKTIQRGIDGMLVVVTNQSLRRKPLNCFCSMPPNISCKSTNLVNTLLPKLILRYRVLVESYFLTETLDVVLHIVWRHVAAAENFQVETSHTAHLVVLRSRENFLHHCKTQGFILHIHISINGHSTCCA